MKVKYIEPFDELRGRLSSNYYVRVLNGIKVVQRCPRTSSENQKMMRKRFGEMYKGRGSPCT